MNSRKILSFCQKICYNNVTKTLNYLCSKMREMLPEILAAFFAQEGGTDD